MNSVLQIMMFIYPILCVFAPCLIYQIILYKKSLYSERISKGRMIWRYIFILYVYMVMGVVEIGSIWEIGKYGSIIRIDEINLIPFQSKGAEGYLIYILNIFMFMPLGFLLPLIWEKYRKGLKVLFCGFAFSLIIELGQLFNRRKTDIDDLWMNVLGAVIGFGIWFAFNRLFKERGKLKDINAFRDNPLIYIVLATLGTFLLYNWRWFIPFVK